MKKIVVDARMVGPTGHGISKYVEGILLNFSDSDPLSKALIQAAGVSAAREIKFICLIQSDCPKDSIVRKFHTVELNVSCYHPSSWIKIPQHLKALGADLFFNPTFASYPSLPCPYVQTIHDLNHLHFGGVSHRIYYSLLLKRSIARATQIFTVSHAMQDEISRWSGLSPEKIKVFYNQFEAPYRIEADTVFQVLRDHSLERKAYFLCVTNPKPHKNLPFLLQAYCSYRGHPIKLSPIAEKWKSHFEQNQKAVGASTKLPLVTTVKAEHILDADSCKGVIPLGGVSDKVLNVLYQECAGFYFPSLYEGFGRPPVEAGLAGAPYIVVSDIPVHHEAERFAGTRFYFERV